MHELIKAIKTITRFAIPICCIGLVLSGFYYTTSLLKQHSTPLTRVLVEEPLMCMEKLPAVQFKEELDMQEYVLERVREANLSPREANVIIGCESTWDPLAFNANKNGSIDLGLWQINTIHIEDISIDDMLDYKKATEWAIQKRLKDGNWDAWVCSEKLKGQ